jgi:hypothetical protein
VRVIRWAEAQCHRNECCKHLFDEKKTPVPFIAATVHMGHKYGFLKSTGGVVGTVHRPPSLDSRIAGLPGEYSLVFDVATLVPSKDLLELFPYAFL